MFNSCVRRKKKSKKEAVNTTSSIVCRHSKERETPLPLYLGLMIHTKTRKRELVDTLFNFGLSISYDRVLEISTDLGNEVCRFYESEKAVCPPNLKGKLFTTAAVDNIDHNPSSTSSHDSFHGTGISLFQHTDKTSPGIARSMPTHSESSAKDKKIGNLPESYTMVKPVALSRNDPQVPELDGPSKSDGKLVTQAMQQEYRWLEDVKPMMCKDTLEGSEKVSWAAYHATSQPKDDSDKIAISSLLPLFYDEAKSVAMIRHSIDVIKAALAVLNPEQVPVVAFDQPLYTIAKTIQWHWPSIYGEDKLVVMIGGLHVEMALLKMLGDLLDGSGWTSALVKADVASPGIADSFLKASHVSRTRRAHQVGLI